MQVLYKAKMLAKVLHPMKYDKAHLVDFDNI